MIDRILDIFFLVFHTALVLFCVFGLIWRRTRPANLLILLATAGSWLIIGLIVGSPGYCPLTDWHFSVLQRLGAEGLPNSYIKYLADRILGTDLDPGLVDAFTLLVLVAALAGSAVLNLRDSRRAK